MIKVLLIDDHAILRDGLKNIIAIEEDIAVVGELTSGEEFLETIETTEPDVILMDINLPDKNGIELTSIVKRTFPKCKVLILTMYKHDEYFMSALKAGADGYILKDAPSEEVIEAIHSVAEGNSILHPSMAKKLVDYHQKKNQTSPNGKDLTDREKDVLICLVEGLSNKDIAERLYISDKTVKIHVSNILKKLEVKSRSQAIIYAVQNQIVPLP
ncbi:response regulator transcription factor [Bacillus sp. Marseille-Q3570]|uniref:response regulator n=1 Tax=Bacillus sp. Marseille-Q3570 TaxID=2963522 RepID=UPI0021B732EF|nr:response regulator transcription factor [Bacillus sp. Marseille-Q3570]